jgi:phage tail protein X
MANTEYITVKGDRWDSIAYKAYGDSTMFHLIADANPNIPLQDTFEGGVRLIVPIMEQEASNIIELLPPWKRTQSELAAKTQQAVEVLSDIQTNPASYDKSFD